jgi:TetR/AcrR family transcriptional repressor of mexJK operon
MDAIATLAGVSKPTVYKHFADEQQLFEEIVRDMIDRFTQPFHDEVVNLHDSGDIDEQLRELAQLLLTAVLIRSSCSCADS